MLNDHGKPERMAFLEATKPSHIGDKLEKWLFIFVFIYFTGHLVYAYIQHI